MFQMLGNNALATTAHSDLSANKKTYRYSEIFVSLEDRPKKLHCVMIPRFFGGETTSSGNSTSERSGGGDHMTDSEGERKKERR